MLPDETVNVDMYMWLRMKYAYKTKLGRAHKIVQLVTIHHEWNISYINRYIRQTNRLVESGAFEMRTAPLAYFYYEEIG